MQGKLATSCVNAVELNSRLCPNTMFCPMLLQEITSIVAANASAPQELAALFAPYLYLLQISPEQHVSDFSAGAQTAAGLQASPCFYGVLSQVLAAKRRTAACATPTFVCMHACAVQVLGA